MIGKWRREPRVVHIRIINLGLLAIDWETVRGLIENAIYGGRVENMLDNGILQAYLLEFFNNKMIAGTGTETGQVLAPNLPMPAFSTYNVAQGLFTFYHFI